MNTKKWLLVFCTTTLLANLALANGGGSSGTTGGGDYLSDVYKLLPKKVTISTTFDYPDNMHAIEIGTKRHFGIFPGSIYAWQLTFGFQFDQKTFKTTAEAKRTYWGRYKKKVKQLTRKQIQDARGRVLLNAFDKDPTASSSDNNECCYDSDDTTVQKIFWDGQLIERHEYFERVGQVIEAFISQVDFTQPETLSGHQIISDFKEVMNPSSDEPLKKVSKRLEAQFITNLQGQSAEIVNLAKSVVDDNGVCDKDLYAQLRAKVKDWRLGTPKYFDQVEIISGFHFEQETQTQSLALRGIVRETINQEVEDECQKHSSRKGKIANGNKEAIIIE